MNKELCIKVGKWNNSILWCTVKKTSKCTSSFSKTVSRTWFSHYVPNCPHTLTGLRRETHRVLCEVRTECVLTLVLKSDRVRLWPSPCENCGRHSGTGTGFSPSIRFSLVSIIPPTLHIHLHPNTTLHIRTGGRSLGNFTRIRKVEVSVHAMKAYSRNRGTALLILNLRDRRSWVYFYYYRFAVSKNEW